MVRGYDAIFANKFLGGLFIAALTIFFIGGIVYGSLRAKRAMEEDSQARRKFLMDELAKPDEVE